MAVTTADARREIKARLMFDEPPLATNTKKADAITDRVIDGLVKIGALVLDDPPAPVQSSLDEFRAEGSK